MQATAEQRETARRAVVDGLARLRALFPLEARLTSAPTAVRETYSRLLHHWLQGNAPTASLIDVATLKSLQQFDAVVPGPEGIGCYPFSARTTGISVRLAGGTVAAMCAVDALAVARLAERRVDIHARCAACDAPLSLTVESDGSLDHDQSGRAQVIWRESCHSGGSCSENLCRNLLFICPTCPSTQETRRYTLPQATALANAFFAFQRELLRSSAGQP